MFKNINKSSGQIAKTLLALAIIVLVALVVAYIVVNRTRPKPEPLPGPEPEVLPVYETTVGNVRFLFLEATDKGSILLGKNSRSDYQNDMKSTERFIEVVVGAQNMGKENTPDMIWSLGDIVDNQGRSYIASIDEVRNWLPEKELCGSILKPSFEPTPCTKIYEVAKVAEGLKIEVLVFKKSYSQEKDTALIDIKLMP